MIWADDEFRGKTFRSGVASQRANHPAVESGRAGELDATSTKLFPP
jgi:hypothetical protein